MSETQQQNRGVKRKRNVKDLEHKVNLKNTNFEGIKWTLEKDT